MHKNAIAAASPPLPAPIKHPKICIIIIIITCENLGLKNNFEQSGDLYDIF